MIKKFAAAAVAIAIAVGLSGCNDTDANVASQNLSQDADNFKIPRRIVFINGITDKYLLEIAGYCSIAPDTGQKKLDVTCKVDGGYKKHFLGLSDNVTYMVEQLDPAKVSTNFYHTTFKPSVILPDIEVQ